MINSIELQKSKIIINFLDWYSKGINKSSWKKDFTLLGYVLFLLFIIILD